MSLIVGIDLGTAGATVSTIKKGSLDVILNEASKRKSPALVSFHNGQRYLGEPASSLESGNSKNTVRDMKLLVGRQWSDPELQADISRLANKDRFRELPNDTVGVEVTHDDQHIVLDCRAVLGMQLGGLKRTSEKTMKELHDTTATIRDVVLSVPPNYTDSQRRATIDAAKIAGLNVLRLLNESTAVALDYGMWKNARNMFDEKTVNVMFVDVGYSSTWVSIVAYTKGKASTLSCTWDRLLGGRDVDTALMEQFAAEFQAKTKMDPRKDNKAMLKLRAAAEKAKQVLTPEGMVKAEVYVEYLMNETDLRSMLTIEQLDAVVKPLADRMDPLVKRAMADAGLTSADISSVEIIGGSSRMRQFKRALGTAMGVDTSKPPNFGVLTTLNADETVSRGCALMCAMLSPQFKIAATLEIKELVPLPIKVQWEQPTGTSAAAQDKEGGEGSEDTVASGNSLGLLKRTDDTPKVRRVTFRRNEPFEIVASYDEPLEEWMMSPAASKVIGKFKISGMPSTTSNAGKIAVTFTHDKSGIFAVTSAQLQIEEVIPPTQADKAQADGKGVAPKKKVVKTDLHVTSQTASFPEDELEKITRMENEFAAKDKAFKDRADKRNELEEFIYAARSDIDGKLKQYASEEEATKLQAKLNEDEAWLYEEEGENATFQQLAQRLSALHTPYDAIQNRLLEIDARTASTERLSQQIQQYLSVANSVSPDHAHITDEERKKVRAACDEALNWLTSAQEAQGKLPLHKDPILTASAIDEKAHKVKQDCRTIVEKPKPKPAAPKEEKAKPAAATEAGTGEEKMDVEGEQKGEKKPAGEKMEVEEMD
jgi:heat shock protein 4